VVALGALAGQWQRRRSVRGGALEGEGGARWSDEGGTHGRPRWGENE
jgi:hypothetical protein